ncbi:MAG: ABC transporter ATP-binding protein [Erysipelotrichales bacterium]|nr:ABC transporter ATP-binding protein [Erysipelotrichales bacterium]MBR3693533.1 ABC transporter ATP-binding protein [Erysipelotrichales bacterium]
MSSISLKNVKKMYGNDTVIEGLNLEIKDGSFTVLVGPSGCGKSTTLRMITGLETVTEGDVFIDGVRVNDVAPGKRDISMVFQNYALYPTMSVKENIEFGLINKKIPKEERERRIKEVCEVVGLTEYLGRMPANLSGGQRQRVALARAMVKEPKVFMMDEPLSNLDAKLRAAMRVELINMHKRMGTTFVYVTHDQVEAMSMADDIVLMHKGKIIQQSSPAELYHNPNCIYTAQFVGSPQTNIIDGHLPEEIKLGFRPEKIKFREMEKEEGITLDATIATREMLGSEIIYSLDTKYGVLMCKSDVDMPVDSEVKIGVAYKHMYLFGADTYRIEFTDELKETISSVFGGC